ncbi:hypothetical protein BRD03_04615 [Halobacteriales archaeon QS_9_68_17]|nr:MAG: hypothetical protein BRD03_04615 [Halobacteriales archaeon QS_9_68_17]
MTPSSVVDPRAVPGSVSGDAARPIGSISMSMGWTAPGSPPASTSCEVRRSRWSRVKSNSTVALSGSANRPSNAPVRPVDMPPTLTSTAYVPSLPSVKFAP